MSLPKHLSPAVIDQLALPSNIRYGTAIFERGGVNFITLSEEYVQAWVGGLDGTVAQGAGSRRRTEITFDSGELAWHCTGNPKAHQIFCKHCVALALAVLSRNYSE